MPKINTPEVSKGFWLVLGGLLALFVVGLIRMLLSRLQGGARKAA